MVVLFVLFCHVALMAPSLFVCEGTFLDCHLSSLSLFPLISQTSSSLLLTSTLPPPSLSSYFVISTLLHSPSSHLMTDMPWTKNGESAAASWNGNRYRDASAPPPAVNVPRKYFTPASCLVFYSVCLGPERERCHFMLSYKAITFRALVC